MTPTPTPPQQSEKDAKLAQKLGQLQRFGPTAAFRANLTPLSLQVAAGARLPQAGFAPAECARLGRDAGLRRDRAQEIELRRDRTQENVVLAVKAPPSQSRT